MYKSVENKFQIAYFQRFILGAANGVRTRDPQLGKLMLYQLSYYRICAANLIRIFRLSKIFSVFFIVFPLFLLILHLSPIEVV